MRRGLTASIACFMGVATAQTVAIAQDGSRESEIRSQIASILAQPEYRAAARRHDLLRQIGEWLLDALRAIADFFARLFRFGGLSDPGSMRMLTWLVMAAVALLVAWALVRAFRMAKVERRSRVRRQIRLVDQRRTGEVGQADELLSRASEAARKEKWEEACRLAMACLLKRLDDSGVVPFDPARTNGEYIRILRERPDVGVLVAPVVELFDRIAYGGMPADRSVVAEFLDACRHPLWSRTDAHAHGG